MNILNWPRFWAEVDPTEDIQYDLGMPGMQVALAGLPKCFRPALSCIYCKQEFFDNRCDCMSEAQWNYEHGLSGSLAY